jgi:hypothetical protein
MRIKNVSRRRWQEMYDTAAAENDFSDYRAGKLAGHLEQVLLIEVRDGRFDGRLATYIYFLRLFNRFGADLDRAWIQYQADLYEARTGRGPADELH